MFASRFADAVTAPEVVVLPPARPPEVPRSTPPPQQLSILEGLGLPPLRSIESRGASLLAQVRDVYGDDPAVVRTGLEAMRLRAHVEGDRERERGASFALGLLLMETGRWGAAGSHFGVACGREPSGSDRLDAGWCLYHQARARIEVAPPYHALALCAAALRRVPRSDRSGLGPRIRLLAARAYREGGDLPRARRMVDRVREGLLDLLPAGLHREIRMLDADLQRDVGRFDAAETACREAYETIRSPAEDAPSQGAQGVRMVAPILRRWGEVLLDLGRLREARRRAEEGLVRVGATEIGESGRLRALLAMLAFEEGDEPAAWGSMLQAERLLREARAYLSLAELLLARGEAAAVRLTRVDERERAREGIFEARGLFRRLGRVERTRRCDLLLETFRLNGDGNREGRWRGAVLPAERPRPPRVPRMRRLTQLGFLTADPRILRALEPLESLARTAIPVLILGESGTGKEVLARALHRAGVGRGPFVPVNCGALPSDLQESELFGHVRGAFTGAIAEKIGLFEAADGGTLLLDEVGEMSVRAQVKLLRVLELGEVRRVGETRTRRVKVRVLAATNADLETQVRTGAFRCDLYYRLCGLKVELPPLRERLGDVPLLSTHFAKLFCSAETTPPSLSPEALDRLLQHSWPGNVRELRFTIEKAVALTEALGRPRIEADCIDIEPLPVETPAPEPAMPGEDLLRSEGLEAHIENTERRLILRALEENGWNRTRAARSLGGISRTTLIGKMKRLGLFPGPAGQGATGS